MVMVPQGCFLFPAPWPLKGRARRCVGARSGRPGAPASGPSVTREALVSFCKHSRSYPLAFTRGLTKL